jgi:hypothetical protein
MSYDTFCDRSFTRADDEEGIIARAKEKGWHYRKGIICNRPFDNALGNWPTLSDGEWMVGIPGIELEYERGIIEPCSWLWMRGDYGPQHLDLGALAYVLDAYTTDSLAITGPDEM